MIPVIENENIAGEQLPALYCNSKRRLIVNWQHPTVAKKMAEAYFRIRARHLKRLEAQKLEKNRHEQDRRLMEARRLYVAKRRRLLAAVAGKKQHLFEDKKKKVARLRLRRAILAKKAAGRPIKVELNRTFFNAADGVYTSYWVGKLISTLLRQGKKKIVARAVYRAFTVIKYTLNSNPLLLFLETLDRIRPVLRLRNRIVRRVVIQEFPVVSYRSRQFMIALHWLKSEIKKGSGAFGQSLAQEIAVKLLDFRADPKKNELTKKRAEYTKRIIMGQFNIRYSWK